MEQTFNKADNCCVLAQFYFNWLHCNHVHVRWLNIIVFYNCCLTAYKMCLNQNDFSWSCSITLKTHVICLIRDENNSRKSGYLQNMIICLYMFVIHYSCQLFNPCLCGMKWCMTLKYIKNSYIVSHSIRAESIVKRS